MFNKNHNQQQQQQQPQKKKCPAPIRTLVVSAHKGDVHDFLFLSDGSFISATGELPSSSGHVLKHFTSNGRLLKAFSGITTSTSFRRLLWVEQDITFLCCSSSAIDVLSVKSGKLMPTQQLPYLNTVRLMDESLGTPNCFVSFLHNGTIEIWAVQLSKNNKTHSAVHLRVQTLKSALWKKAFGIRCYSYLCSLKDGRFVEVLPGMTALWERTQSTPTPQWQCTRFLMTPLQKPRFYPMEIYDGMVAVGILIHLKSILVLNPSVGYIRGSFEDAESDITHTDCFIAILSLSMRDRETQVQRHKRLLCALSERGCLLFWDMENGNLVKREKSELLSGALCMKSGRSTSGNVVLLIGKRSYSNLLFQRDIMIVEVLPLLYGDGAIASTSLAPSVISIHECEIAKKLATGHFGDVTALEVMEEDGTVLSGSIDGSINLWSPDMKWVLRSFSQSPWIDKPINYKIKTLRIFGEGCFVSTHQHFGGGSVRVAKWSVNEPTEPTLGEVFIKLPKDQLMDQLMVLDHTTICTTDKNGCHLWSLINGSLKKVLEFCNSASKLPTTSEIEWICYLGISLTEDGHRRHLLAVCNSNERSTDVWDIISLQVIMVIDHQFARSVNITNAVLVNNLEVIVGFNHKGRLLRIECNPTTGSSPVKDISMPHRHFVILDQNSLERPHKDWSLSGVDSHHLLKLRDGTICAVQNRIIRIINGSGGCLATYGFIPLVRITSIAELINRSLAFGLGDGRIVILNRLPR